MYEKSVISFPHEKKRVTSTLKNHLSRVSLFFSIAKNERLRSRKTADARTKRTSETRSIFCADKDSRLNAFTRVFIAARAWKISAIFTPGSPFGEIKQRKNFPPKERDGEMESRETFSNNERVIKRTSTETTRRNEPYAKRVCSRAPRTMLTSKTTF
jgi:hypothetical protein